MHCEAPVSFRRARVQLGLNIFASAEIREKEKKEEEEEEEGHSTPIGNNRRTI